MVWPTGGLCSLQCQGPRGKKSTARRPVGSELPGFQLPPGPQPGQPLSQAQLGPQDCLQKQRGLADRPILPPSWALTATDSGSKAWPHHHHPPLPRLPRIWQGQVVGCFSEEPKDYWPVPCVYLSIWVYTPWQPTNIVRPLCRHSVR